MVADASNESVMRPTASSTSMTAMRNQVSRNGLRSSRTVKSAWTTADTTPHSAPSVTSAAVFSSGMMNPPAIMKADRESKLMATGEYVRVCNRPEQNNGGTNGGGFHAPEGEELADAPF